MLPFPWRLGNLWYRLHIRWAIRDCLTPGEIAQLRATELAADSSEQSTDSDFSTVSTRSSGTSEPRVSELDQLD